MSKKQYRLRKWYPSLPKEWKVGEIVKHSYSPCTYSSISHKIDYRINIPTHEVENNPEFWEEVVKKEYEILSFMNSDMDKKCPLYVLQEDGLYHYSKDHYNPSKSTEEKMLTLEGVEIYSVKRLSDGEVFTIGDHVKSPVNNTGKITAFEKNKFDESKLIVRFGKIWGWHFESIQHVKKPLFRTEDGVDIYEGDACWYVSKNFKINYNEGTVKKYFPKVIKYFSTKEKAEKYIDLHKPRYSKKEIMDGLCNSHAFKTTISQSKFEEELDL